MSPLPRHGTPAGDAFLALRKLARDTGQDAQDVYTMYTLERLLARVATSAYRDDFVLKGGVLLAVFAARRPTKDIDLQATQVANDVEAVTTRFREIISIDLGDGLVFDPTTITASVIREEEEYEGIRLRLRATLGKTRLFVGVDVNFGDPIWPAPQTVVVPPVADLGRAPVTLTGYPLPMVIAEKAVTMIKRGEANTRWRDFADVHTLQRLHSFDADVLLRSMTATADHRGVALAPLLPRLVDMPERAQAKWAAWRAREERHDLPKSFGEVLQSIAAFIDPVLRVEATGTWRPETQEWV